MNNRDQAISMGGGTYSMDTKSCILELMADVRRQSYTVMKDMTDAQFNRRLCSTANPIGAIFIHMVGAEDDFIQAVLQHKPPYWEVQGWAQKIGVPLPPMPGRGWDQAVTAPVKVAVVLAYEQVVRAATEAYLADLTSEELEREVYLFGNATSVWGVLKTSMFHSAGHLGEIAALKGGQGVKGLPD
jgi:uncharacterized damage-inducible protein DinB